jgi:hypothetical protein
MIANGIARESLYAPAMSELRAHQISTVTGSVLLLAYTWMFFPWLRIESPREAWIAGALWLVLTVAFEFLFGHFVARHSWRRLLQDYHILEGRLWSLFLLLTLLAPRIVLQIGR